MQIIPSGPRCILGLAELLPLQTNFCHQMKIFLECTEYLNTWHSIIVALKLESDKIQYLKSNNGPYHFSLAPTETKDSFWALYTWDALQSNEIHNSVPFMEAAEMRI